MKMGFWLVTLFVAFLVVSAMGQGHGDQFEIAGGKGYQHFPQTEYDPINDQFLIVWEEMGMHNSYQTDIYGRFMSGDGSEMGDVFAVCDADGNQWWPRLAFDPHLQQFLVVFEDNRLGDDKGDVSGVLISSTGDFVDAPTSGEDHTFLIASEEKDIYTCSVAFNFKDNVYLVVWGDNRTSQNQYGELYGKDIYGQLVAADGSLILPSDPAINFPIDTADWYDSSVADVTYNAITNEFFVVYGTTIGYVLGQRVDSQAQLIAPDGTVFGGSLIENSPGGNFSISDAQSFEPHTQISEQHDNYPDCLQPRDAARTGNSHIALAKRSPMDSTEVQVVWKGMNANTMYGYHNDVYGQRIGFFKEGEVFVTHYLGLDGLVTDVPSNFPISLQPGWAWEPEIAYNERDDEFLVGWGDPRDEETNSDDMYMQRLWINDEEQMIFLADDRVNTVTNTENIPVATTTDGERSPAGIAYNDKTNKYLLTYQIGDYYKSTVFDVVGNFVNGSVLPQAASVAILPQEVQLTPGDTQQFTATVMDDSGKELDLTVEWSCDDGAIDQSGLFTAGATTGQCTITATELVSGVIGTATVNIVPTNVENKIVPVEYALLQNYPNPFNPETMIEFHVKNSGKVKMTIYDVSGKAVQNLVDDFYQSGIHKVLFNGSTLPTGLYFYEIQINEFTAVNKMILME